MNRKAIIAVLGDGYLENDSSKYVLARALGRELASAGYRIACGGLGGAMEAVCRGAHDYENYQEGTTVGLLPGHDPSRANPWVDIPIATGLDVSRNSVVAHADAVIALGGGAGTLSEVCFAWMFHRLIIGMKVDGWSGRLAGLPLDGKNRYPDISDDRIYAADDALDACRIISEQLPRYRKTQSPIHI